MENCELGALTSALPAIPNQKTVLEIFNRIVGNKGVLYL